MGLALALKKSVRTVLLYLGTIIRYRYDLPLISYWLILSFKCTTASNTFIFVAWSIISIALKREWTKLFGKVLILVVLLWGLFCDLCFWLEIVISSFLQSEFLQKYYFDKFINSKQTWKDRQSIEKIFNIMLWSGKVVAKKWKKAKHILSKNSNLFQVCYKFSS